MTGDAPGRPLRMGILGAARIAPAALVKPARDVSEVEVAAVAARNPARAAKFARKHRIPRVHATYDALLADPEIDAVYNPLPNALHCEWTLRALDAGKPVLCEKPVTSNAAEAEQLGPVSHLESWMCIPLPLFRDIRYRHDLAGGATMDLGCYCIHELRFLAGAEPEVAGARTRLSSPQVDRWMQADFRWADGRTGRMTCALWSSTLLKISLRVTGDDGEMRVLNPTRPQSFHRLSVRSSARTRRERVPGDPTYTAQLRAFVRAVRDREPFPTGPADAVANMRVVDDVYRRAGLEPRGT
jgi:predicted dehydrogenase